MSVTSYNPNEAKTINALTQAQLLSSRIDSSGAMISTLSAPKTQPIEEAAYALRGAAAIGDEAYMASNAIKNCADIHPNFCRLDLPKAA